MWGLLPFNLPFTRQSGFILAGWKSTSIHQSAFRGACRAKSTTVGFAGGIYPLLYGAHVCPRASGLAPRRMVLCKRHIQGEPQPHLRAVSKK